MPGCCAIGCFNRSEQGYRMFLIPQGERNEERRNQWILNIGRPNLSLKSVVCEAHFTGDQFENKRQDNKRFLKWKAVPTIFNLGNDSSNANKRKSQTSKTNKISKKKSGRIRNRIRPSDDENDPDLSSSDDCNLKISSKENYLSNECEVDCHSVNSGESVEQLRNRPVRRSSRPVKRKLLTDYFVDNDYILSTTNASSLDDRDRKTSKNVKDKNTTQSTSKFEHLAKKAFHDHQPKRCRIAILDENTSAHETTVDVNVENICRVCGTLSDSLLSIFGDKCVKKRVAILINFHLPIQVSESDEWRSRSVCDDCIKCLTNWGKLFNKCKEIEEKFRKLATFLPEEVPCSIRNDSPSTKNFIPNERYSSDSGDSTRCPVEYSNNDNEKSNRENEIERIADTTYNDHNYCPRRLISTKSLEKDNDCSDVCDPSEDDHSITSCGAILGNDSDNNLHLVEETERYMDGCDSDSESSNVIMKKKNNKQLVDQPMVLDPPFCNSTAGNIHIVNENFNLYLEHSNNDNSGSLNKLSIEKESSEKTNEVKPQEYKIGITLVKNKVSDKIGELDINTLKSILIKKVSWLFQSICNDKTIGKSLIKASEKQVADCKDRNAKEPLNEVESCHNDIIERGKNEYTVQDVASRADDILHSDSDNHYKTTAADKSRGSKDICPKSVRMKMKRKKFLERTSLRIENEDGGPGYLCGVCGHILSKRKSFEQHRRVHHTEKKCNYCDLTLPSFFLYRRHIRESHKDIVYTVCCELCNAKFMNNERLQRHKLVVHNVGEYLYCDICAKKCASKQQLHCHKSDRHHSDKYLCPHCGDNFVSHNTFSAHLKSKHVNSGKIYSCTICHKQLSTFKTLLVHTARHASMKDDASTEKEYQSANAILNSMLAKQKYTCLVCNLKLADVDSLKEHMRHHSDDDSIKSLHGAESGKWICRLCSKYFEKEKALALHRFYSHDEIPFACKVNGCESSFWWKSGLIIHRVTVHNKTHSSFKCSICSESFKTQKQRQCHIKMHHSKRDLQTTTTKKFTCDYCQKKFSSETRLKEHKVTHLDIKNYQCQVCDRSFESELLITKHLQFHNISDTIISDVEESDDLNSFSKTSVTDSTEAALPLVNSESVLEEPEPAESYNEVSFEISGQEVVNNRNVFKVCTLFRCCECNKLFMDKDGLDEHIVCAHSDKGTVQFELNDVLRLNVEGTSNVNFS